VIVPAFNEASCIGQTLERLAAAERRFTSSASASVQVVVVDNASTDGTGDLARRAGATVVHEAEHNIGKVRNAGVAAARHDVLVFLDADTLVPSELLLAIAGAMADPGCAGGAVDTLYRPRRLTMRAYLGIWRVIGLAGGMAQGACQFCRRSVFQALGGYDQTQFMGEDVDFYWRLKRLARRRGLRTCFIRDLRVVPSARRFDRWPVWRTLVWTNPLLVLALRRRKAAWTGWYTDAPR
jgi:glycosyltransferase involved in cell wall biosynthesis